MRCHIHRAATLIGLFAVIAVLAGCGSSSSSSSSGATSSSSSSSAATTGAAGAPASSTVSLPGNHDAGKATTAAITKAVIMRGLTPHLAGLRGLSFVQKLATFGNDVADFWVRAFSAAKIKLPGVTMYLVGRTPGTCDSVQVTTNSEPVYCGSSHSIFLPVNYLHSYFAPIGDAAVLLEVSSLYGYHLEDSFGYFTAADQGRLTGAQLRKINLCLSGVYFSSVGKRNLLTNGDARAVTTLIADKADAPGTPAGVRVTARELTLAFLAGFKAASVAPCIPR